jgi:peptide-methionine (R)-S-oxide reductase
MMTRRRLVISTAVGFAGTSITRGWVAAADSETFEVTHTDAEWRKLLTPDQFAVLRTSATERPFTSQLLHEKRRGNFACAGCDLDLFSSTTKFESGTGWPSFWTPLEGAIGTTKDTRASACCEPLFTAAGVAAILVTCSMTVPSRRACATA